MGQTPDEIRREIEETRERMGETAQAIAARLNVPARVKGRIGEMKGEVGDTLGRSYEAGKTGARYVLAGVLVIGLLVGALVLRAKLQKSEEETEGETEV